MRIGPRSPITPAVAWGTATALVCAFSFAAPAGASEPASGSPEGPATAPSSASGADAKDTDEPDARPGTNGLMIGGYVTAGLAVAAVAPLVTGVVQASQATDEYPDGRSPQEIADDDEKRQRANLMAAGSGIAAGALGITAIVLVAVGKHRRDQPARAVAVAPTTDGRASAGLVLTGRF